jgi:phage replication-related protein YjqB (UPF0714/DUF867 family)
MAMIDRYESFQALARDVPEDWWRVVPREMPASEVLVIAPHGGGIEIGTSELAAAIAGDEHNLYCFEGLRLRGNRDLHVTSHRFDEPVALALAARCSIVVSIHGCRGHGAIHVGGLDRPLAANLTAALLGADFPVSAEGHPYPATHPRNICNRGRRGAGVQLEFTAEFRGERHRWQLARLVRQVIAVHAARIVAAC